jgi:1-deoxy-D-xylulose-5-phosphate reductoisomerase
VMAAARRSGSAILPVDSEHSAVFQCLAAGRRQDVARVVLTASGGPFRTRPLEQFDSIRPADALKHPNWDMGPKITVDSATMMNKALELIEARWLFELPAERLGVVIHPQSLVHSFVEYADGSVLAQASPPDMRLPIQYALTFPERLPGPARKMDWGTAAAWEFLPPDPRRYPALELGFEVVRQGGNAGAALNAANETAVARFLAGTLRFADIVPLCADVLRRRPPADAGSLAGLLRTDAWARQEAAAWIGSSPDSGCS